MSTQVIPAIDPAEATGATRLLFTTLHEQMGGVANIFRTMGHSPATLEGYLALSAALAKGELEPALREQIALACAGANGCDYCASAHTALGKRAGIDADEAARNLAGRASDPRADAVLSFVRKAVRERGRVTAADVAALRGAGLDDGQVVEVIGHIAANLFTNYLNLIAGTAIDFPVVRTRLARAA